MFKWLKSLFAKRETVIKLPNTSALSIGLYNGFICINGNDAEDNIVVGVQHAPDLDKDGEDREHPCIVTCLGGDLEVHRLNTLELFNELARMLEYKVTKL